VPLQALPQAQASFAVYNSPLSETAALGFEYGYRIHAPGVLVLWEAQFGDFANGAQVIIDQFLASGNAKWRQHPSVVLLLPHGYEGMGPEHSSARLERFLQLCAGDNMRVVNCTTSAQYFHVLRRQAALLATDSRPLVVMTPKSLLRHPRAASPVSDLAHGSFQSIIDDPQARQRADRITRVVLCSGKVYVDLTSAPAFADAERVAAIRVEQLYPFPIDDIKETLGAYPNLRELVWLQEEPRNMGAWSFVSARLREQVEWMGELRYIGRPESASPAEGSISRHMFEQSRIVKAALHAAPEALAPAAVLESVGAMR
jgi:2-oxoglutarate dehydrogenase E1 component